MAFAVNASAQEADLLAVLRSNASVQEKSTACRLLAQVATREAVPVLAELLADEKLSHMARYAFETIQDPSVDEACVKRWVRSKVGPDWESLAVSAPA